MALDRQLLADVGEYLFGSEWRRAMARALGPLHPRGARETIDPRLPARWATGERDIPAWVGPALGHLLQEREERVKALNARINGPE
ncbi:hypothetical protein OKC48_16255 [Methylorubrum extorquens]|uniref:hypothetical protein n=1 Tax=Methylorubrum extorquens TaxID=408 RepID=UPI0022386F3E|nr:hypothetical protein [Methylorubrum extorquens]UYW24826.1 hypothetical protein OKC48_16255 [Methylorubrum extorquens]